MYKLTHKYLMSKNTDIYSGGDGGAPHTFYILRKGEDFHPNYAMSTIVFQHGHVSDRGINGITNEDLIAIIIHRLEVFQAGEFSCEENAKAISNLESALLSLNSRAIDRERE